MKTILVPTNFSKGANNALMYALEIAQQTGTTLTVLYVIYPNEGVNNNMYDAFFIDDYVQQRLDSMKKWIVKLTRSPHLKGVEVKLDCRVGFPVSTISKAAEDLNASLIVMGTTGASGLNGILLGSTAGGVLSSGKTPVFVVPHKAVFRNFARFAFATDFKIPVSQSSMQMMREMLNLQHTGLNILHVVSEAGKEPNRKQEDALSEKLGTIPHDYHYLHNKDIVSAIHNFLEATDCNGLVVVAHEHSLLHKLFGKSISRKLAHHSRVPILVLHDR